MKAWLDDNLTKVLGYFSTTLATLMTMIASGMFEGLMEPKSIRWLGIFGMLVGGATVGRGYNNTSREKVAEAMSEAIRAVPGEPLPPHPDPCRHHPDRARRGQG